MQYNEWCISKVQINIINFQRKLTTKQESENQGFVQLSIRRNADIKRRIGRIPSAVSNRKKSIKTMVLLDGQTPVSNCTSIDQRLLEFVVDV